METTYPVNELLDPSSCGEDLTHNAERFSALAPRFCSGCADYHIRSAFHRYAGPPKLFDRPELIRLVSKIIADKVARSRDTIEIAVTGSADTAMLATAAHAVAMLGSETLKRCRFTVIDRCRTPLLVCEEFAAKHGLDFRARQDDLLSAAQPCAADLIITHSVFRFIPHAEQPALLRRIGSWLAPEGRLVLSNRILLNGEVAEAEAEIRKRTAANKAAEEAMAEGRLRLAESPAATLGRLERAMSDSQGRPGEFRSLEEVKALVRQAGLAIMSIESLAWEFAIGPGDLMRRRRVHAVLGRADGKG
jgi:hypothetical protein